MSHDAFISYSTLDKTVADATCAALEAVGIRCWIAPRDILPGAEWGEAIIEAINRCRVVVLIFSGNANDSPQIRREIERAVSKGIAIIPLRIQDVAPARSLEYFIGTVHWLDALTPPLDLHLRRLGETIKSLLRIEPAPPRIVLPPNAAASSRPTVLRVLTVTALSLLALSAVGLGIWRYAASRRPVPAIVASRASPARPLASAVSPPTTAPPQASAVAKTDIDPALIGTFESDSVVNGYSQHSIYTIAADGSYRLVTIQEEDGAYRAGNGRYRTIASKTGRVRVGSYQAVGDMAIEVTSAMGSAVFTPAQPIAPLNEANPVMLGVWRASVVVGGLTWILTIQNDPDGVYHYDARTEDSGRCACVDRQWRATSAVSGLSDTGIYRVLNARNIEITTADGSVVWRRQ